MDLIDERGGEIQASTATGRFAEVTINFPGATQALGCGCPNIGVTVTVADANVHAITIYE
jgi:hypothetical protein